MMYLLIESTLHALVVALSGKHRASFLLICLENCYRKACMKLVNRTGAKLIAIGFAEMLAYLTAKKKPHYKFPFFSTYNLPSINAFVELNRKIGYFGEDFFFNPVI